MNPPVAQQVRVANDSDSAADTVIRLSAVESDGARRSSVATWARRVRLGLAATDALAIVIAMGAAYSFRFGWSAPGADFILVLLCAPAIWTAIFYSFRLYAFEHLSPPEEFARTLSATSVGVVAVVLGSFWWTVELSRMWLGVTWVLALVLELVSRRAWRYSIFHMRKRGTGTLRTLIIGANQEAAMLAEELDGAGLGYDAVGHIITAAGSHPSRLPMLGGVTDLADVIDSTGADCLFVAATAAQKHEVVTAVQAARRQGVDVRMSANVPELLTSRVAILPVGSLMTLSIRPARLTPGQMMVKRAFDIVVASAALVITSPLLALAAIAIRGDSRGRALFRQPRVTRGGRPFEMVKFRTMRDDADRVLAGDVAQLSAPFFKMKDDPRLTRVGRVLRSVSIDELPQLLNVLRGEMSLIGPRPLPVEQVEANFELLNPRHEVRAGITGWWQINGRSDISPEEAVRLDLFYIENWSLSLDLYILLKTVGAVVARRGAY